MATVAPATFMVQCPPGAVPGTVVRRATWTFGEFAFPDERDRLGSSRTGRELFKAVGQETGRRYHEGSRKRGRGHPRRAQVMQVVAPTGVAMQVSVPPGTPEGGTFAVATPAAPVQGGAAGTV